MTLVTVPEAKKFQYPFCLFALGVTQKLKTLRDKRKNITVT